MMIKKLIVIVLFLILSSSSSIATEAIWDPSAGATGYKVHLGKRSGDYNLVIDVGNVTSYELVNATYPFVVVSAYNQNSDSGLSEEVDWKDIICRLCDLNGDGKMSGADYVIFKRCYASCDEVP